jgi:2'-5' RNA ligase
MRTVQDVAQVKNHWWWRPGWQVGRHFYACHITFENEPAVQRLAAAYREPLTQLPGLDLIPRQWLHLTMQGIGFTDEVSGSEISVITAGISGRLASITQPVVTFARPIVQRDAIFMPAAPADALDDVRRNTHEAIKEVLGPERSPDMNLAQALQGYKPHVSIAYVNKDGSASPYIQALRRTLHDPVELTIRTVSILTFHRDNRMYEWTDEAPITIGG